jgi:hypothetical protein
MERPFVIENARERERLRKLVNKISDEELGRPLFAGWNVAVDLAHLAFWDQWSLTLMRKWEKSGVSAVAADANTLNDTLVPILLEILPRRSANLALSSAEAIDKALEQASDDFITEIEKLAQKSRLYRSIHRKLHLDEIEAVLNNSLPKK